MIKRRISAHYIFPGKGPLLKFGILELAAQGEIVNLTNTGGRLEESPRLEFYNGILVPGFLVAGTRELLTEFTSPHPFSNELEQLALESESLLHENGPVKSPSGLLRMAEMLFSLQELLPGSSLEDLLALFTSKPASCAGLSDLYGSFGTGMKPGVYLLKDADLQQLRIRRETRIIPLEPMH